MRTLDFSQKKKQLFTVILDNEKKTKLLVKTPTKTLLAEMVSMAKDNDIENANAEESMELIDQLYNVCARALSNNMQRRNIQTKELENIMMFDELVEFFQEYMTFTSEAMNQKN